MSQLTSDEKINIIDSEMFYIKNIQILLKDSFLLKELNNKPDIYPCLMLIEQLENHINTITKLF